MVVLGGAFFALGNINPAAEANVYKIIPLHYFLPNLLLELLRLNIDMKSSYHMYLQILEDPEAADIVFTSGANIDVVGINITTQFKMSGLLYLVYLS